MLDALIGQTVSVTLPYTEVCMSMRVAGRVMSVEVQPNGAQLLATDGSRFSFPITHGEAGIRVVRELCLGTVWVCTDCMIMVCNGDESPDRPSDLPPVLALLGDREDLTPGMLHEEHPCGRTAESWGDDNAECDCETNEFSQSSCDACGDHLHGTRHAMTLWTR